jgi:hypothetical protein
MRMLTGSTGCERMKAPAAQRPRRLTKTIRRRRTREKG